MSQAIEHQTVMRSPMGSETRLDLPLIGNDDPVPLELAAEIFYPLGGVTEQTLKTEIRNGRLVPELTGGKYFVTRRAINEMRELCRGQRKVPGSTSEKGPKEKRSGLSETERTKRSLDAAKAKARKLKDASAPTSSKSTTPEPGKVIHAKFS